MAIPDPFPDIIVSALEAMRHQRGLVILQSFQLLHGNGIFGDLGLHSRMETFCEGKITGRWIWFMHAARAARKKTAGAEEHRTRKNDPVEATTNNHLYGKAFA